jgi:dTDP-4-dehydrorhamnose reductase
VNATVLIAGAGGQLGRELCCARWPDGWQIAGTQMADMDIADDASVARAFAGHKPSIVVNAAAYTAVDRAESEPEKAFAVNEGGPRRLAVACASAGIPLIHVSTDYVFDGTKTEPYLETDAAAPLSVYGRSKLQGEIAVRTALDRHLILRTSWLYSAFGSNFVKTMLQLSERGEARVVSDRTGSPTSAADLATVIVRLTSAALAGSATWGTYHAANSGWTSWHGFAQRIFDDLNRRTGRKVALTPIATADYPTLASRPANSRLDCGLLRRTFGITMRRWEDALDDVLDELAEAGPQ